MTPRSRLCSHCVWAHLCTVECCWHTAMGMLQLRGGGAGPLDCMYAVVHAGTREEISGMSHCKTSTMQPDPLLAPPPPIVPLPSYPLPCAAF